MALERQNSHIRGTVSATAQPDFPSRQYVPGDIAAAYLDAADIAFTGLLVRETWAHSYSPSKLLQKRKARKILEAVDSLQAIDDSPSDNKRTKKAKVIARRLQGQQDKLRAEAEDWDPVQTRHAILQAANTAADSGKFYFKTFEKRTGLTNDQLERIREEVPPAAETAEILTQEQRFAAEAVCSRLLLQKCFENARANDDSSIPKLERYWIETGQLLKAHLRLQYGKTGETVDQQEFDRRAQEMIPDLEAGRDKIFDKAQVWSAKDCTQKLKATAKVFKRLEDPEILSDLTGIPQAEIDEARKSGRLKTAGSWGLMIGNEAISHVPGIGVATEADVHALMPQESWIAWAASAGLYAGLAGSLALTSLSSANLLKRTGVGLDPLSKASYDYAVTDEKKKAFRGALKFHAAWEGPFFALGIYIGAKHGAEAGLAYFNTASIAGIAKNMLLVNPIVGGYARYQNSRDRKNAQQDINSFLPK